jgi:hypothetical protein
MPVASSILWKPLRDSHYVIVSLQPGAGGLRQIFIQQSTLRTVQAVTQRDPEQPVVGLLLGERLECPLTLTPYLLIESHMEAVPASLHERGISDAIRTLRSKLGGRGSLEVLGWYCTGRAADASVSRIQAAVHAACFQERWQTVLTFGDGNAGAFFLHDASAARWFTAPFYEVTDAKNGSRAPKATCVEWPEYLTTMSVVPLAKPPKPAPSTRALVTAPVSAPVSDPLSPPVSAAASVPGSRSAPRRVAVARWPIIRTRRTPSREAVIRAGLAAGRSVLDFAKAVGHWGMTVFRQTARTAERLRAELAAYRARRKAEADAARARDEERRAREEARKSKAAAERRAAREEAQRREREAATQRAAEVEAARQRAAEVEAARQRAAEVEAARQRAAEVEAARQRTAEAEAQRAADAQRVAEAQRATEAEARRGAAKETDHLAELLRGLFDRDALLAYDAKRRQAEGAEVARPAAELEAQPRAAEAEAEARRRAEEAEVQARRRAADEQARLAAEQEAQRRAAEAEQRRVDEAEEARREDAEAETQRRAAEAEEVAARQMAEAEARRQADEAEAQLQAEEAEALRLSAEVAALKQRLSRPPVEGSKPNDGVSHATRADAEDTTASDTPDRYLALAQREGFEVSVRSERGTAEHPLTMWLLHDAESGLRLIVETTDVTVRAATLHYNLRTENDALLQATAPEHRDLESRTIYSREACLDALRARCRHLRATGSLQRDWKVWPTRPSA